MADSGGNQVTDTVILKIQIEESGGKKMPEAKKEVEVLAGSIVGLSKANKALREERNKLDTATESGRKRIIELNNEINKNNAAIKENSSALEKQRLNVGNYTGALDQLVPGLGATVNGFSAMKTAALAFIATPIGAVIGALGLAIAAVTRYFQSSEEGQNKFAKISRTVSIVIGNLSDKLSELGKFLIETFENPGKALEDFGGLIKSFIVDRITQTIEGIGLVGTSLKHLFKGEFSQAADAASEGFKKIALNATPIGLIVDGATKAVEGFNKVLRESADEIAQGQNLEDMKAQTDLLERQLIVQRAVIQAKIAELKLRGEDKNLDIEQRRAALTEALNLQDKLGALETTVARNRFKIKEQENSFSNSTKEDLNEQAELEAKLYQIQKDNADKKKEIFIKNLALETEEQTKAYQARLAAYEAAQQLEHEIFLAEKAKREEAEKQEEDIHKRFLGRIKAETKARQDATDKDVAARKAANDEKLKSEQELHENVIGMIGFAAGLFKQNTIAHKVLASAEATMNTYAAATRALRSFAPPLSFVMAALTIATGLRSVGQINNVKFAQGGQVRHQTIGGKFHSAGGTKFFGEDGTAFEAERDEGIFIMKRSANKEYLSSLNQKHGGRSWGSKTWYAAQGGQIEARDLASRSRSNENIARILVSAITNMPHPVVFVADIRDGVNTAIETEVRSAPM